VAFVTSQASASFSRHHAGEAAHGLQRAEALVKQLKVERFARGGLEAVLHQAVKDPENPRMAVIYDGPNPDMLRVEAQAILTGTLDEDGVFMAEELLLKCPTKYEEALPEQVE